MTGEDRTVQVPVSLIEQIDRELGENAWHPDDCPGSHPAHCNCAVGQARRALRALFSQPTPTADPDRTYTAADVQEAFERGCIRGEQDANERNWSRREYEKMQAPLPTAEPRVTPEQRSWQARMLRDAARNTSGEAREWLLRRADWFENPPLVGIAIPTAEPHRIEDMAPGTTFTASRHGVADLEEFKIAPSGRILCRGWSLTSWHQTAHHLNSSTIRDVTPPKGGDRG